MRYSLAKLARRTGRKSAADVLLPPISARFSTENQYRIILQKMVRAIAAEVRSVIIPAYRFEPKITTDVDENIFTRLKGLSAALAAESSALVNRILQLESERHTETFMKSVQTAIGIDISSIVTQEDLAEYLRTAAARNTSLIKSLADETVKRVEQAVLQNAIVGGSSKQLRDRLTKDFGVADSRAKLIARDQTAKINSDLNRIRQEQAGIESYEWMTSADERVRPLHQSINGKQYDWGKPTGAEQGLPPGQPIQCRCVARGVVEFGAKAVKPAPVAVRPAPDINSPEIQIAVKRMDAIPRTDLQDGFGSTEWFNGRVYDFDGDAVRGKEAAIARLTARARNLAQKETGVEFEVLRERKATIVIGPPAAGKSTIANSIAIRRRAAIPDVDDAKTVIPEFRGGIGANAVHEESSILGGEVLDQLVRSGDNLVIPKVGHKLSNMEKLRQQLEAAGYEVDLVLMDVDPDVALGRMLRRFDRTGRLINPEYFMDVASKPRAVFNEALKDNKFDGFASVRSDDGIPARVSKTKGKKSSLARGEQIDPGGKIRPN